MKTFRSCLVILLLALIGAGPAPRDISPEVKEILDARKNLPGLIGAIVEGDHITAIGAAGVRKAGSPDAFTSNDLIHLGSCTKAMTAVLVGQLVDANKLSFDSKLSEIFPELKTKMNPLMADITVLQLLHHRAGLTSNLPWAYFEKMQKPVRIQRRMVLEQTLAVPPLNPVGKFEYSNLGYLILGAILEQKTNMSWEDLIKARLFIPLKMTSAGFGPPSVNGKIDQPWGHTIEHGILTSIQFDNPAILGPAGRVHCTITDWAKFVSLFLDAGAGRPRMLKQETFDILTKPEGEEAYACGWMSVPRGWGGGGNVLTHAGFNTTWYCVAWAAPNRNFAVLLATNAYNEKIDADCDALAGKLIEIHDQMTN